MTNFLVLNNLDQLESYVAGGVATIRLPLCHSLVRFYPYSAIKTQQDCRLRGLPE